MYIKFCKSAFDIQFQISIGEIKQSNRHSVQHIQLDSSASSASYLHNIHVLYKVYEKKNLPI